MVLLKTHGVLAEHHLRLPCAEHHEQHARVGSRHAEFLNDFVQSAGRAENYRLLDFHREGGEVGFA